MGLMGGWSIVIIAIAVALAQIEINLIIHVLVSTIVGLLASLAIWFGLVVRFLSLHHFLGRLSLEFDFWSC